jgi:putative hydrolase of the HAD superfamily
VKFDMRKLTLLIDADDTLWENNVFFEQTIEAFIALAQPLGYSRDYARRILNETERQNIRQHGYGVKCFARSLEETYRRLAGPLAQTPVVEHIGRLVEQLEQTPPQLMEGVPETLAYLHTRHKLILFTKGQEAEQAGKVARSGLERFFAAIEIVREKDAETYAGLVSRHRIVKTHGWIVGNSPRSDINPALQAGLSAVFIPHQGTWELENEELQSGAGRLLVLSSFSQLREHF